MQKKQEIKLKNAGLSRTYNNGSNAWAIAGDYAITFYVGSKVIDISFTT